MPGAKCAPGLVCAGPPDNRRCVMPMGEGGQCRGGRDPYWVCVKGLVCINNTCQKPRVKKGGSCRDEDAVCEPGTVCAGPPDNPRCVMPMGPGKQCGGGFDPFWVCEEGLMCINRICKAMVGKGGSCRNPNTTFCKAGLVCAGTRKNPRCVMPMGKGGRCGGNDPYWVCRAGLRCVNRVCV